MVKNIAIKSSFLQDLETRKRLKDLNLHELWNLILVKNFFKNIKSLSAKKLKDIYFNQKITHLGIGKEQYLRHPLRMAIFCKKYFPNSLSRLYITILFHNILEVGNFKEKEIITLLGKDFLNNIKILTINRNKQNNMKYLKNYYSMIIKNKDCFLVKIIDKYDNLFDLNKNNDIAIKKSYIQEIENFINPNLKNIELFEKAFLQNLDYNKKIIYE